MKNIFSLSKVANNAMIQAGVQLMRGLEDSRISGSSFYFGASDNKLVAALILDDAFRNQVKAQMKKPAVSDPLDEGLLPSEIQPQ